MSAGATLATLGIVFGDLGTSPLYTMQTILTSLGPGSPAQAALGVLSLIIWTLLITISVKYCLFVMRADNDGEGGILALMSMTGFNDWRKGAFVGASMGLLGAALIYGDGVITPSISVLSALEGVNVATPALKPFILPLAITILAGLFAAQRFGTATIGKAFGPVMLVWFLVIGGLGLMGILHHPVVLKAFNPLYAVRLLISSGPAVIPLLGGVFLCATGGEALYADMGHFGPLPIRVAWYGVVLPTLILSYAGQTGLVLDGVAKGANPFFLLAPPWAVIPLVVLATLATIIASQAIITGAFSMTRQAIQLGWLPGMKIFQTSDRVYGQIFVPAVNAMMAIGTIAITLAFRSSDRLAGAYGTAVSTTMVLTTLLLAHAMRKNWRWPLAAIIPVAGLFLIVDIGFFAANLAKIADGGWVPLTLGLIIFGIMITWRSGMQVLREKLAIGSESAGEFLEDLKAERIVRVPGVAAFLTRPTDKVPAFLHEYAQKMGSLHDTIIALHIRFQNQPRVEETDRSKIEQVAGDFWRVTLNYGFVEVPDLREDLKMAGLPASVAIERAVFFGTRDLITPGRRGILQVRLKLFAFLHRNALRISERFNLPPENTVEITRQIEVG